MDRNFHDLVCAFVCPLCFRAKEMSTSDLSNEQRMKYWNLQGL